MIPRRDFIALLGGAAGSRVTACGDEDDPVARTLL